MKRFTKLSILVFLFGIIAISCSEDFLSPKPLSFHAPENVYVDEAGFESLLITMRRDLKQGFYGYFCWSTAEFAPTDLAVGGYNPDFTNNTPGGQGTVRIPYLGLFNDAYGFIKNANVLISRIDNVDWDDQEVRNRLLAEAYWHRAYLYYRLIHSYGDVPFIGEEVTGAKLDFNTHSRWTILDKIQEDLEWAVEWMPETAAPRVPTKYAGFHLLTKIYLANTEFENAIAAASSVIDGPHALMTNRFGVDADDPDRNIIWDLHRHMNINDSQNTETILGLVDRFSAPSDARRNQFLASNFSPHWWDVPDETGARGVDVHSAHGDTLMRGQGIVVGSNFYQFDLWAEDGYTWSDTPDLRRADINWIEMSEITYNEPESPNFGEPINWEFFSTPSDTMLRWYSWPHHKTYNPSNLEESTRSGGHGDSYVYRLAETYLLRAEAHYWMDNLQEAANDINVVRARAEANPISANEVTIDYIFDERARELYVEETRHAEMVRVSNIMARLNIDGYNLDNISQGSWWYDRVMRLNTYYDSPAQGGWIWNSNRAIIEPHNIYWPIPESAIIANTMGTINQNEGYPGAENNEPPLETIEE